MFCVKISQNFLIPSLIFPKSNSRISQSASIVQPEACPHSSIATRPAIPKRNSSPSNTANLSIVLLHIQQPSLRISKKNRSITADRRLLGSFASICEADGFILNLRREGNDERLRKGLNHSTNLREVNNPDFSRAERCASKVRL